MDTTKTPIKEKNMKKCSNAYQTDKRYAGVRRKSLGGLAGFGEDFSYYIQYRDKFTGKVVMNKVGNESEGWNFRSAYLEKEKRMMTPAQRPTEEVVPGDATIWEIWFDYVSFYDDRTETIKTQKFYMNKLKSFHKLRVSELNNRMIQDYQKKLMKETCRTGKPYAAQSIVHIMKQLRKLINFGVKRELCEPNPKLHFDLPKVDNQKTEFLNDEQLKRYMEVLDSYPNIQVRIFLKIALYTGMRGKAILGLKWSDINFEDNMIKLRADNSKSQRTDYIPLPDKVKTEIQKLPHYSEYLFPNNNGGHINSFKTSAQKVKELAGLPKDFRAVYMLRHNFATHLANSGKVDLYTIQKLMTHHSPKVTQRYAHLMDKTLKEGSKVIEDLFSQAE